MKKYEMTVIIECEEDEIIGAKEQLASVVPAARVVRIQELKERANDERKERENR